MDSCSSRGGIVNSLNRRGRGGPQRARKGSTWSGVCECATGSWSAGQGSPLSRAGFFSLRFQGQRRSSGIPVAAGWFLQTQGTQGFARENKNKLLRSVIGPYDSTRSGALSGATVATELAVLFALPCVPCEPLRPLRLKKRRQIPSDARAPRRSAISSAPSAVQLLFAELSRQAVSIVVRGALAPGGFDLRVAQLSTLRFQLFTAAESSDQSVSR